MTDDKRTTIQIYQATKAQLDELGKKGDTYDDIIRQLLSGLTLQPKDGK